MPLHTDLAEQEVNPKSVPFGVAPENIPCVALESKPGDLVLFHQCTWHAAFGGQNNRRYIAWKFAAKPFADDQVISLARYTTDIKQIYESFINSDEPRIREMIANNLKFVGR